MTRGGESRSRTETIAPGRDDTISPGPAASRARAALVSVCLGFFVIQLDVTIANVALPAIQREIGGSLAGRLTARYGPRPPMIAGLMLAAAGSEHAGVASGILNAARQSGGALGVAVLGSLLGNGSGHPTNLRVPLAVATAGYLIAVTLAWSTIRPEARRS